MEPVIIPPLPDVTGMLWAVAATVIGIVWLICWTIVSTIRVRHREARWGKDAANLKVPPMFEKMVDKAMAERDGKMQEMLARIQVLEKIVTDSHTSKRLSDEIESLREKP